MLMKQLDVSDEEIDLNNNTHIVTITMSENMVWDENL